eukprot:scaffold10587_cov199-Ochromonas_danica.AAC.1
MPVASLPPIQEKEADGDSGRLSQVSLASSVASFILSSTTKVKIAPELIAEDNNTSYDLLDDRPLSTSTSMTTRKKSKSSSSSYHNKSSDSLIIDNTTNTNTTFYTPPSSTMTNSTTMIRVEVEDTGIGMSQDAMQALFSPFKQAQRLAGGTGLGLFSLAKRMEALQGKCGVMPRHDGIRGSIFWFAFPYKPDYTVNEKRPSELYEDIRAILRRGAFSILEEPSGSGSRDPSSSGGPSLIMSPRLARSSSFSALINRSASTEMGSEGRYILTRAQSADYNQPTTLPPPSRGNGSSGKRLHILLVDDTPSVMKMTSMLLRRQGFEVTSAENGAIALDLIQANLDQQINALQQQQQQQQQARNKKGMIKLLDSNGDGYGHSSSGGGCEQETEIGDDNDEYTTTATTATTTTLTPAFDYILMDLQMPIMDGLETVKRLRGLEKEYSNKMMMLIRSSSTTTTTTTPTSSQLPCLSSYPTRESMSTTRTMRSNDDDTNTRKRSSKKETTTTVSSRSGGSGSIGGGLLSIISRSLTSDRTARYYEEGSSSSSVVMDLRDDLPDDNNNNTTTANTNTNTNNTTSLLHHVVIGVSANNDDETQ